MDSFADPVKNISHLHLRAGATVADLGAGSGHYAFALGEKLKSMDGRGRVYAIDVQKHFMEKVKQEAMRRGLGNVEVLWGDIEMRGGTKLADNICDVVVISNVLFQSQDKLGLVQEAIRILKPGGEILIIDWKDKGVTANSISSIISGEHLSKIEEFDAGSHHWGMLLKKV